MRVAIATIPHKTQDYPTVGNWQFDEQGRLTILVSETEDDRYNALIALHEFVEAVLCRYHGVNQDQVTAFDVAFEGLRGEGDTAEPGDDDSAPYFKEHQFATKIEKLMAKQLDVPWKEYDKLIGEM